jgi:hypothetical protein
MVVRVLIASATGAAVTLLCLIQDRASTAGPNLCLSHANSRNQWTSVILKVEGRLLISCGGEDAQLRN